MTVFLFSIGAALVVSAISFSGLAFAIFREEKVRAISHYLVSLAIGTLLGVAFLDILPEAFEMIDAAKIMPFVIIGILLFFILERFLFWYHCHEGVCEVHTFTYLILWGDLLHNFIDGMIVALAFMTDIRLGLMTAFVVMLHEIPQEIGDFSTLIHGGLARGKAFLYNFLVSLSIVLGVFVTFVFGNFLNPLLPWLLAIAAGNFIYIAATDLMPEFHQPSHSGHAVTHILLILLGLFMIALPDMFLGYA